MHFGNTLYDLVHQLYGPCNQEVSAEMYLFVDTSLAPYFRKAAELKKAEQIPPAYMLPAADQVNAEDMPF